MTTRKTGQLIERERGIWTVRVYLGEDAEGKRKYHNETIKGSKKEAQKRLTQVLREKDTGTLIQQSEMPLKSFLEKWLTEVARLKIRERTFRS